jgi:hypothetical protein
MFIIPDQGARRVLAEGGLAGARQAEEHRRIVRVAPMAWLAEQCIAITPLPGSM